MIRVLHVISDSNIGGAGRWLLEYLKRRIKEHFEILVALPKNSQLEKYVKELKVNTYAVEGISDKSLSFRGILELIRLIKKLDPDIVHSSACFSSRIAAKILNKKVIYTSHCAFKPSSFLITKIGKKINRYINDKTCDKIIAVAKVAKDNLILAGIREQKIRVVLNGIWGLKKLDDSEIKKQKERCLGLGEYKVIGIVARLSSIKGHMFFLETARIMKDRCSDVKFIIAGTGETEKLIKKRIKDLNLQKNVIMTGFLSDVTLVMNMIDVQVNCSYESETTSLSLLEGMSLGKPSVVTDIGGNPCVVKHGVNGFVAPAKNPGKMADFLIKVVSDVKLYTCLSSNCLKIFREKFDSSIMAKKIEDIYMSI